MNIDTKYYCPECGEKFSEDDSRLGAELFCPICKSRLNSDTPSPTDLPTYTPDSFDMGNGFFSFRTMVSRILIQIIYILGALGLSIYGIIIIGQATQQEYGSGGKIVTGLCILTLGNLIWRIICEAWILLFNIHDVLVSIERKI
jgi:DNA-directed RNA polymerase subunit RPC12/RpoP